MGQIGSGSRPGHRALDRVAHDARPAPVYPPTALLLGILRLFCGAALFLFPLGKVLLGLGHDMQRHMRVLRATKLGALPAEGPRPVSRQVQHVHLARDQILLAIQVGDPKAVNYVVGTQYEAHRLTDRDVDFVGADEGAARFGSEIPHLPPPLVSDDLDTDRAGSIF